MAAPYGLNRPRRGAATMLRMVLLILAATLGGAALGAAAFLAILHDPLGAPQPATPAPPTPGNEGWAMLFNLGFGLFGAAVGGLLGASIGIGIAVWRWWTHRAVLRSAAADGQTT